DVPARFRNSKAVGAVFGLTPAKYKSGETDRTGAISRCGDEMMRMMLYEAAQSMLVRSTDRLRRRAQPLAAVQRSRRPSRSRLCRRRRTKYQLAVRGCAPPPARLSCRTQ